MTVSIGNRIARVLTGLMVLILSACSKEEAPVPLAVDISDPWQATIAAAEAEGSVICACPPVGALGEFLDAEWAATV